MAGFAVRHPKGHHVLPYKWVQDTEYENEEKSEGGNYELCVDNQFSRYADKLVNLYITTFRYVFSCHKPNLPPQPRSVGEVRQGN